MALYVTLETQNNRPNVVSFFDDSTHSTFVLDLNVFPWLQLIQDVPNGIVTLRNQDITYAITATNVVQIASNTYSNPSVPTVWQDLITLVFQHRVILSEEEIIALISGGTVGVASFNGRMGIVSLTSTDVTTALGYTPFHTPTGTNLQYITGAGNLQTFPTELSQFTNDSGFITASSHDTLTNKQGLISQWTNDAGYVTSSSGSPGGSNYSVQYNGSGTFAGDSLFMWNYTTHVLSVLGNVLVGTSTDLGSPYILQIDGSRHFDNGTTTTLYYTDTANQILRMGSAYELFGTPHADGGYTYYLSTNGWESNWNIAIGDATSFIKFGNTGATTAQILVDNVTLNTLDVMAGIMSLSATSPNVGITFQDASSWNFVINGVSSTYFEVASSGNILIGTTVDSGSGLLQVAGIINASPSAGVGTCIEMGGSGFINTQMSLIGASANAPGFQEFSFVVDGTGKMRLNENISGAQILYFTPGLSGVTPDDFLHVYGSVSIATGLTVTGLASTGTMMVTADINGVLGVTAFPTGAPGGTNNDVQFNEGGALTADTGNFTYDPTTGAFHTGATDSIHSAFSAALGGLTYYVPSYGYFIDADPVSGLINLGNYFSVDTFDAQIIITGGPAGAPIQVNINENINAALVFTNLNAGASAYAGAQFNSDLYSSNIYQTSSTYGSGVTGMFVIQTTGLGIQFYTGGPAMQIAPTQNVLIGTQTDAGSGILQVAGIVAINPSAATGVCLELGSSAYTDTEMIFLGQSANAPGFQEWAFVVDTTGKFRIDEAISGAQILYLSPGLSGTTPDVFMHVYGSATFDNVVYGNSAGGVAFTLNGGNAIRTQADGGNLYIDTDIPTGPAPGNIIIRPGITSAIVAYPSGNVAINYSSSDPGNQLYVNGTALIIGGLTLNSTTAAYNNITMHAGVFYPAQYSTADKLALSVTGGAVVWDTDLEQVSYYKASTATWVNV